MTDLRPASHTEPARWLLRPDVHWWDVVRFGPPGFEAYLRIALLNSEGADWDGEHLALRTAIETLAEHTSTPASGYAAVWKGWTQQYPPPGAPRVPIPNRTMLLFAGPVDQLRDAPSLGWWSERGSLQEPHLVWPEDQAWCVACEVDEEVEFTVGCSAVAAEALVDALPGSVRQVGYGDPVPMFRD